MNLKNLSVIFILLISFIYISISQDDRLDEYSFDDSPLQEEKTPYFAISGGLNVNFSFINFDELNNHLIKSNFFNTSSSVSNFEGNLLQLGGEGFTGLIYLNNFRLSISSYTGTKTLESNQKIADNNYKRYIDFSSSFTGFSIDYAIVPFKKFAILPGLSFGRGGLKIDVSQTKDQFDWSNYKPGQNDNQIYRHEVSNNYWVIKPQLNLEYALTNFLMFRLGVAYSTSFGNNWKYNNSADVINIPEKINSNGLILQTGIFLGLFNY